MKEAIDIGEIRQLWFGLNGINPKLKYALRMILLTGQRPGEVLNARWDDFLMNGVARWVIPVTKNLGVLGYLGSSIGILLNHSSKGITAVYNQSDPFGNVRIMLEAW